MLFTTKKTNLSDLILERGYKNLGTFSTTHMEEKAKKIFFQYAALNGVDTVAYPELAQFEDECAQFMLNLCGSHHDDNYHHFSTSGSSEAIFMSLAFMKHHWELKNIPGQKPNVILGKNAHVSWLKAAMYLGVEIRFLSINNQNFNLQHSELYNKLDEHTIGVACTLGATTTLTFDDVEKIDNILRKYNNEKNIFIPIHVDGASGGFIAPFYYPELNWNFKLKQVMSINISSHKFGMVYPSLGWLLLKHQDSHEALAHACDYLGKTLKRYPIRFSHSASQIAAQHYYIKSLGYMGYKRVVQHLFEMTNRLKNALLKYDEIELIEPLTAGILPGIIFGVKNVKSTCDLKGLSCHLKKTGWHLPIFNFQDKEISRMIVRYGLNDKWIKKLLNQIEIYFLKRSF